MQPIAALAFESLIIASQTIVYQAHLPVFAMPQFMSTSMIASYFSQDAMGLYSREMTYNSFI